MSSEKEKGTDLKSPTCIEPIEPVNFYGGDLSSDDELYIRKALEGVSKEGSAFSLGSFETNIPSEPQLEE
jgi:hypothetical protein